MKRLRTSLAVITLLALCFSSNSCMFFTVEPARMDINRKTASSWSATRVHLRDGSVVVFPRGFRMAKGEVKGEEGVLFDLLRRKVGSVESVPRDSVECLQVYKDRFLGARSGVGIIAVPIYVLTVLAYAVSGMNDHVTARR
jgi:hypothetical protein